MVSNIKEESHMAYAEELYASLQSRGIEVMLDDRKERFGFKMSDAELIGFPFTVIVGKELENGLVQIMVRSTREMITVNAADVLTKIEELRQ
jgi:prolyl-tRNA synthetase